LQSELERLRLDSAATERDLRSQLSDKRGANTGFNGSTEWKEKYESLKRDYDEAKVELREQQQVRITSIVLIHNITRGILTATILKTVRSLHFLV
jgi:hypothetical protein